MSLHGVVGRNFHNLLSFRVVAPYQSKTIKKSCLQLKCLHNVGNFTPRRRMSGNGPSIGQEKGLVPTPFHNVNVPTGPVSSGNLLKATIFAFAFSAGSFAGVAIWEYETIRRKLKERRLTHNFNWFKHQTQQKKSEWRKQFDTWWNSLTPGERIFVPICVINMIVFAMWRSPRLQPFMVKYFCSNPSAPTVCWPMLLSTFSHYSLFHLFANMYVLHSFASVAVASMGREQFLGMYLSAGVLSTLASYFYKATTGNVGLSLGASGAIMAILAYVCFEYPDTKLSILFLPMYTFPAGTAIKLIMGLDLSGCLLGWKFFDHAAHLGGAFFGMLWCFMGKDFIWPERQHFVKYWHEMRTAK